ncbi:MAG: hypothetical protein ACREQ5_03800 [Candidatus Dormibacteria bacterium]
MVALRAYCVRFYQLAHSKVTTYVCLGTAGLNELLGSWDQTASLLPHWLVANKQHVVSLAALLGIWSRIRRELKSPADT